jgi:hypothetical protein
VIVDFDRLHLAVDGERRAAEVVPQSVIPPRVVSKRSPARPSMLCRYLAVMQHTAQIDHMPQSMPPALTGRQVTLWRGSTLTLIDLIAFNSP